MKIFVWVMFVLFALELLSLAALISTHKYPRERTLGTDVLDFVLYAIFLAWTSALLFR